MIAILLLKRLVIPLAVLGGLFYGANVAAERFAEDRMASAARTAFDLPSPPDVDIRAFPVLVRILQGTLPEVVLDARQVDVRGLTLESIRLSMRTITANNGFLASDLSIVVGSGEVRARAGDASVNAYLKRLDQRATIAFADGGLATVRATRTIRGARRRIVARGIVSLRRGRLTFTPRSVTVDGEPASGAIEREAKRGSAISVRIPRLPGDIVVTGVSTSEGGIELAATLEDYEVAG